MPIKRKSKASHKSTRAMNDLLFWLQDNGLPLPKFDAERSAHLSVLMDGGLVPATPEGAAKFLGIDLPPDAS